MEPERRFLELRQSEGRLLEGAALVYSGMRRFSRLGRERISPGAFSAPGRRAY